MQAVWSVVVPFILIGFVCAFALMIVAATYIKWREVQTAKAWLSITGHITGSRSEAREVNAHVGGSTSKGSTEFRNFAKITFQYKVNDKTFTSSRHSLRHDIGNVDVAGTLARYPKGSAVIVYYDPANPSQSVLERTMPDGSLRFMLRLSAGMVIGVIGLAVVFGGVMDVIRQHLPNPENIGASVLLLVMALLTVRMAFVQQALAKKALSWPVVKGVIMASGLQAFHIRDALSDGGYRPWRRAFKSRIVYGYSVQGQAFVADRVVFGAIDVSSLPSLVYAQTKAYTQDSQVDVHYDPSNPSNAVLECRVRGLWLLWGVATMLFAVTILIAFRS